MNFEKLFNELSTNNGFTVNKNGIAPTKGYCVGITPVQFISVFDLSNTGEAKIFEKISKVFIEQYNVFDSENAYFGTWHNSDNGLTYFDKVKVFGSLSFALKIAFDNRQLAIWDLENQCEITVPTKISDLPEIKF